MLQSVSLIMSLYVFSVSFFFFLLPLFLRSRDVSGGGLVLSYALFFCFPSISRTHIVRRLCPSSSREEKNATRKTGGLSSLPTNRVQLNNPRVGLDRIGSDRK